MQLNIEVCKSSNAGKFVWRVRSTKDRLGSDFLACGECESESDANNRARQVKESCETFVWSGSKWKGTIIV